MKKRLFGPLGWACGLFFACGGEPERPSEPPRPSVLELAGSEPILPLPAQVRVRQELAALGGELFNTKLISEDGKVSCASCHERRFALADGHSLSKVEGRPATATNSTTLYNVAFLSKLTWSGKFDSLETHIDALMKNPKLMGSSWDSVAGRLSQVPAWQARFQKVFPDGINPENARAALLEYERSLVTPNCPFDRWLRGDADALSLLQRRGYGLFKAYGCASCHQGMAVGGNMLQRFGVMRDYFADRGEVREADLGRFLVTGREEDRHVFRVPSLRNVALTAPYFHDGSAPTLQVAIQIMGEYQLGREISTEDVQAIAAFLESLTGELD